MKTFSKPIRRLVTVRGSSYGLPNREWVLTLDADGVAFREAGTRNGVRYRLPWRSVLGLGLVTGARQQSGAAVKS